MPQDPKAPDAHARAPSSHSTSPYPLSRMNRPFDLVDLARELQQADAMISAVAGDKLRLLADQIRALQEQARAVLEEARRDAELHRAECNFQKRPGRIYHLYRRADGRTVFSMLSPEDWRGRAPHEFLGSYRLEVDLSWTATGDISAREDRDQRIRQLVARDDRERREG